MDTELTRIWLLAVSFLWSLWSAQGASITLLWDAGDGATGYKVYSSTGTAQFVLVTTTAFTTATVPVATNAVTRFYVVSTNSVGDDGPSNILTNIPVIVPTAPGLVIEANSGIIVAPFVINGSWVGQPDMTSLANGGRGTWTFTITNAANYTADFLVNAPSEGANSIFWNIDAEPSDPAMIWDIPVTTGLQTRTAAWRGTGTFDHNQFVPKVFALPTGTHRLIVRGREGGVQLYRITFVKGAALMPGAAANLRVERINNALFQRRDLRSVK